MTHYDKIQKLSPDDVAWLILTVIENTEQNMLNKLAEYGLEISLAHFDPNVRHKNILLDLLKEYDDGSDT